MSAGRLTNFVAKSELRRVFDPEMIFLSLSEYKKLTISPRILKEGVFFRSARVILTPLK